MPSIAPARLTRLMVFGLLGGVFFMTFGLVIYESWRAHQLIIGQQQQAEEETINKYRQRMKYEAEAMQETFLYQFGQAEFLLRQMSREQVDAAHTVATSIYNSSKGILSDEQIKTLIIETLRNVSFFQGRGYIFIDGMDGECILLPTNPELEGTSLLDNRDATGIYIMRNLIDAVKNKSKRGYTSYSWYRPGQLGVMAEKIAYARQFEPYDWLIGSGDYVYRMEKQLLNDVLVRAEGLKLPSGGYLAILDYDGNLLTSNSFVSDLSKLPPDFNVEYQQQVVQGFLDAAEKGGDYVEYKWSRQDYDGLHDKLGYVISIPEARWVVIATGYRDDVLSDMPQQRTWLARFIEEFPILVWPFLVIGLVTLVVAMIYARWLGRLINYYQLSIDEQQERLQILAERDPLTDLPNRWLMGQELMRAMDKAAIKNHKLALFVIDIDRFKDINDSLGHAFGDKVLQELGRRMEACVEQKSFVARMGGDEFVLLIESAESHASLVKLAKHLLRTIHRPVLIEKHQLVVTASIGIAIYPEHGVNQDILLRHADIAMYQAKARGRDCYCFYSRTMGELVIDRLKLEHDLREAIKIEEGMFLVYQPQWDLSSGKMVACEALVRWRHPVRGLIQPLEFIPLAEETGLILELGSWVLRNALAQVKAWQDQGLPTINVAVNLSTAQLNKHLPAKIAALLQDYNLPAEVLEIEVTETLLMTTQDEATAILTELKDTGIRIALDDFGTGYSSLSYLSRLPLNVLKIDKSFVDGLPNRKDDVVIAHLIIRMAAELGITTLAEGVETQEQLDFLKSAGCHLIQGYLLARPLPPEEVAALLLQDN